jgi:3-oxoacyl-[acyl-carrier protein] reductase
LISGGASGIGRAMAFCLAEEGAQIVIADLNMELANQMALSAGHLSRISLSFWMGL